MENSQQNIVAIGRKRFPIEEIALVEPYLGHSVNVGLPASLGLFVFMN